MTHLGEERVLPEDGHLCTPAFLSLLLNQRQKGAEGRGRGSRRQALGWHWAGVGGWTWASASQQHRDPGSSFLESVPRQKAKEQVQLWTFTFPSSFHPSACFMRQVGIGVFYFRCIY